MSFSESGDDGKENDAEAEDLLALAVEVMQQDGSPVMEFLYPPTPPAPPKSPAEPDSPIFNRSAPPQSLDSPPSNRSERRSPCKSLREEQKMKSQRRAARAAEIASTLPDDGKYLGEHLLQIIIVWNGFSFVG